MAVPVKVIVMWDVTPCSLIVNFKTFLPVDNVVPNYTTSHPRDSTLIVGGSGMCPETGCFREPCQYSELSWSSQLFQAI